MKKIKTFYKEHKKTCFMVFAVFVLFVAFSVTSALHVSDVRNSANSTQVQQEQNTDTTNTISGEKANKTTLTDVQQELINNYSQNAKDLIDVLKVSLWSCSGDATYTLQFFDDYYIDVSGSSTTQHSYAISHIEQAVSTSSDTSTTSFVIVTDTGTHVVKYQTAKNSGSNNATYNMAALSSADAFSKANTTYERSDRVQGVKVSGLNEQVLTLLGNDVSKIEQAFNDYCSLYLPTVTEVTWGNTAEIDYSSQTVICNFKTGDKSTKKLRLTYDMQNNTYKIG